MPKVKKVEFSAFKIGFFLAFTLYSSIANAYDRVEVYDSIKIKANTFLILGNSTFFIKNDTIIYLPETVTATEEDLESPKTKAFYDLLKKHFYKNRITREIYDLLFTSPPKKIKDDPHIPEVSENPFIPFEGKIIGDIRIKKLDVFGPTLEDTGRVTKSWAARTANKLHIDTQDWVIYNNMLVKPGDYIEPEVLADNERVIRLLPFIRDVRIIVVPRADDEEIVDLLVLTNDVWSISADFSPRGFTSASLALSDRNILGFGHEFINRVTFDNRLSQNFGYEGIYRIPNLRGTFITGDFNYANTFFRDGYSLRFFRNFITPDIKYAGGLEISNMKTLTGLTFQDTSIIFPFQAGVQDLWVGRAYPTAFGNENLRERSRFVMAGRVTRTNYTLRPEVTADTNQSYHSNTLILSTFGLSTRKYYKDRLIYGYGRTEDIPYGNLLEITTGVSLGEFYKRPYIGLRWARGGLFRTYGYTYLGVSAGSFIRNNRWEQGVLKLETNYFSNLIWLRNHRIRQFINVQYTLGIRRFADEFINIRDENGIRGLRNEFFLRGTRKLVLSVETVDFTPFYLMGFRLAVFGFADVAMIAPNNVPLLSGNLFQGYGVGFRIRNDNLTFNAFQLRLAYYPTVPPGVSNFGFNVDGLTPLRLDDFDIQAPNANLFD
ncbi:hypothetical protein BH23BAC1_BH23BAC1_35180 [soil metagenome]